LLITKLLQPRAGRAAEPFVPADAVVSADGVVPGVPSQGRAQPDAVPANPASSKELS
jgi:hypothetical protein